MKKVKILSTVAVLIFNSWIGLLAEDVTYGKQVSFSSPIHEKMNLIDPGDLSLLENLFRNLFVNGSFAYTLFGPKPMTNDGYSFAFYDRNIFKLTKTKMVTNYLGWKVWQKYSCLFPSKNFYLKPPTFADNPKHLSYVIINKAHCKEIISKHLAAFQKCIGAEKTIQEILDAICSSSFFSLCKSKKGHTTCLGLLFGYGEKNSQACEKREILLIQALFQVPYHLEGLNQRMRNRQEYFHIGLQPKSSIDDLEQPLSIQPVIKELNELQEIYHPIALVENNPLCPIGAVRCAGMNEDPETKALQAQYESLRQKLVDIYNSDNFLELILTQLSS
jgi:hypothetical protein